MTTPVEGVRIALTALGVAKGLDVDNAMDLALYVTPIPHNDRYFDELIHEYLHELEAD